MWPPHGLIATTRTAQRSAPQPADVHVCLDGARRRTTEWLLDPQVALDEVSCVWPLPEQLWSAPRSPPRAPPTPLPTPPGTSWRNARAVADGTSTPVTATPEACSSAPPPGVPTAARERPGRPAARSRSLSPRRFWPPRAGTHGRP